MTRLLLSVAALAFAACQSPDSDVPGAGLGDAGSEAGPITGTPADAPAATVQPTSTVRLDYAGTLPDGSTFDSGSNVTFPMSQMVPGFRDGMIGMGPGETKTFDVQPGDGYGDSPPPGIPVGAVLTFEVTVHEVM